MQGGAAEDGNGVDAEAGALGAVRAEAPSPASEQLGEA